MERRTLLRALTAGAALTAAALAGGRRPDVADPTLAASGAEPAAQRSGPTPAAPGRPPVPGDADDAHGGGERTDGAPTEASTEAPTEDGAPGDAVADASGDADDAAVVVLPAVTVLCRAVTGLSAARGEGRPHRIGSLTLHHTAVRHDRASEAPRRMRGHQRHHQAQGWIDVAYHYGVDLGGNVYELRDVDLAGDTFTDYDPAGHFLVVCEGDYDQQRPTDAMLASVAGLFANASVRFGVPTSTIAGHRDHASTRCPGTALVEALPSIRDEATRLAELGAPGLSLICGAEGAARIATIEAA